MSIVIPTRINQTTLQWASDSTVYSANKILCETNAFYGATDQCKFKLADGTQTWAQLDYFPVSGYDDATSSIQSQLNGKASLEIMAGSTTVFSPLDSTTTYIACITTLSPNVSAALRPIEGINATVGGFWVYIDPTGVLGSNEEVIFNLYNITDAVVVGELGRISFDKRGRSKWVTGLNLTMTTTKDYSVQTVNPVFGTNPTNVAALCKLLIR